ncbi:hypothetical protein ABEB36_013305 [Hypothenemus hampei]|uniref:Uncharacterized protein n=1 Tax=Hypothenemus hampei TaxID=57062 RepID=A0ABD1E7K1_HYPHA
MCKISCEKCLTSFVLLLGIMFFVSICSSFPIDDDVSYTTKNDFPNRIYPRGRIEAMVFQNSRSQRSSGFGRVAPYHSKRHPKQPFSSSSIECQYEHFSSKAYKSEIVLLVSAQGFQRTNYTVSFKHNKTLKNSTEFPIHDCLTLQFTNRTENCPSRTGRKRNHLVTANIKVPGKYVLFLNVSGANKCFPAFSPEELPKRANKRKDMLEILEKIGDPNFKVKRTTELIIKDRSYERKTRKNGKEKIKLVCKANGLPVPQLTWKRNNFTLRISNRVRISYVKKRSILVIRNPSQEDFLASYKCMSREVDGRITESRTWITESRKWTTPQITLKVPCNHTVEEYCMGNGNCFVDLNDVIFCECGEGYSGEHCDQKMANHARDR